MFPQIEEYDGCRPSPPRTPGTGLRPGTDGLYGAATAAATCTRSSTRSNRRTLPTRMSWRFPIPALNAIRSMPAPPRSPPAAGILNRSATAPGVLQLGGEYIHCGEPMKTHGADLRSIYAPIHTDRPSAALLEVYLRTKVLHCVCGFQIEIPQEEGIGGRRTG